MLEAQGPNAQQISYWNEVSGPKWVRLDETINKLIAPLGSQALRPRNPESAFSTSGVAAAERLSISPAAWAHRVKSWVSTFRLRCSMRPKPGALA